MNCALVSPSELRKTGGGVPSRIPSPVAISPAAYSSRWHDQHAAAPGRQDARGTKHPAATFIGEAHR